MKTSNKKLKGLATAAGVFLILQLGSPSAAGSGLNPYKTNENSSFWAIEIQDCPLNTTLLYSVSLVESAAMNKHEAKRVNPWPYAFRSPEGSHYSESFDEAVAYLDHLLAKYKKSEIDVGIMQINLFWHEDKYERAADLLEPEQNIAIGCKVLTKAIQSSPDDLVVGIGRYNHWKDLDRTRKYGKKVLQVWGNLQNLVATNQ